MTPVEMIDHIIDWVTDPARTQRFTDMERYLVGTMQAKIRPRLEMLQQYRGPDPTVYMMVEPEPEPLPIPPEKTEPFTAEDVGEPVMIQSPEQGVYYPHELPPEKGPKATRAVWVEFAEKLDIEVVDEMGRGAIMAAVHAKLSESK